MDDLIELFVRLLVAFAFVHCCSRSIVAAIFRAVVERSQARSKAALKRTKVTVEDGARAKREKRSFRKDLFRIQSRRSPPSP